MKCSERVSEALGVKKDGGENERREWAREKEWQEETETLFSCLRLGLIDSSKSRWVGGHLGGEGVIFHFSEPREP